MYGIGNMYRFGPLATRKWHNEIDAEKRNDARKQCPENDQEC